MSLFFKALHSSLPSKDGKKKWHPRLVKMKEIVSTQKVGELIAEKSSLTPGDVHNVIRNLMTVMREQLMNSRSIRLDGLGTFTVMASASGNGVDTAEEVNPAQITKLRIKFTPEYTRPAGVGMTRAMFSEVKYERWAAATASGSKDDGDGEDPGDGGWVDPSA